MFSPGIMMMTALPVLSKFSLRSMQPDSKVLHSLKARRLRNRQLHAVLIANEGQSRKTLLSGSDTSCPEPFTLHGRAKDIRQADYLTRTIGDGNAHNRLVLIGRDESDIGISEQGWQKEARLRC